MLEIVGILFGVAIRGDVPLPLDLLPCFWKTLVRQPLDDSDILEAHALVESVSIISIEVAITPGGGKSWAIGARVEATLQFEVKFPVLTFRLTNEQSSTH